MTRHIVLSGCSGGGKSTLLAELAKRRYATVPEPGRRVIAEGIRPWENITRFITRCIELAIADYEASVGDVIFYDRSVLDALIWFDRTGQPLPAQFAALAQEIRYHPVVFLTPPWPEIYVQDADRQHGYKEALAEYHALCDRLPEYGYKIADIPKAPVAERADWIEAQIIETDAA